LTYVNKNVQMTVATESTSAAGESAVTNRRTSPLPRARATDGMALKSFIAGLALKVGPS
jgi:hypothetical protein